MDHTACGFFEELFVLIISVWVYCKQQSSLWFYL